MNKLYIDKYYRDKKIIEGYIYDRPLKDKLNNFRISFTAEKFFNNTYSLSFRKKCNSEILAQFIIDETYDGKMNLRNILYYFEQHKKMIMQRLCEKEKSSSLKDLQEEL